MTTRRKPRQPAAAPAFSLPATYTGEDWTVYRLRPGARDHERCGSLQPDGSVRPYCPPQPVMTSSVPPYVQEQHGTAKPKPTRKGKP